MTRPRIRPLTGAAISVLLFALVVGSAWWSEASRDPEEATEQFADLGCAAAEGPRVHVTLPNATFAPGTPLNATVTVTHAGPASTPFRLDSVHASVHAITNGGRVRAVASSSEDVTHPLRATDPVLAPGIPWTLESLGASRVAWNGTVPASAVDTALATRSEETPPPRDVPPPGLYALSVELNRVAGTPCEERVMGYQVFEIGPKPTG